MADEKMDKKGLVYLNDVVISANVYVLTLVNLLLTCNLIVQLLLEFRGFEFREIGIFAVYE